MKQYSDLVQHVLDNGTRKENRTGVDTLSTFGYYYEHDMREGFPLLTTKNVSWKNIVVEMLWFLSGQTDISILKRHGCKFWDAWADENGKVPSAYGNFWRQFPVHAAKPVCSGCGRVTMGPHGCPGPNPNLPPEEPVMEPAYNDQIAWVLAELQRNPMSRRMVVSAWAPGNAQTSKLPPCHCLFMFNVQNEPCGSCDGDGWVAQHGYSGPERDGCPKNCEGKPVQRLCLHLTQRSCDVAIGIPFNIASYALLLSLFSHFTGIEPGIFGHSLVDAHVYTAKPDGSMAEYDHIPGLREQLTREPYPLPKLIISPNLKTLADIEALMSPDVSTEEVMRHFVLEGYESHPFIPFKVAV